jgi:transcriptional regulator with XRE-family HTH domain
MIGDELKKAREAAGLTQQQVAAKAGITREYVSYLETGKYTPTVDVLMRLCAALGTKGWVLLRRVEEGRD